MFAPCEEIKIKLSLQERLLDIAHKKMKKIYFYQAVGKFLF